MIGIGFSSKTVSLSRAPGWEPESWGYHGDDGHCFAAQTVGKSYGPKFGPGDTVGCLVNFRLGQALFTRNGIELRTYTSFFSIPLAPIVFLASGSCLPYTVKSLRPEYKWSKHFGRPPGLAVLLPRLAWLCRS
jgi:hypothetical protein